MAYFGVWDGDAYIMHFGAPSYFLDDERDGTAWLRVEVEIQRSASTCHILISIMLCCLMFLLFHSSNFVNPSPLG